MGNKHLKNSKNKKNVLQKSDSPKCVEFYVNGMHCAACELVIEKKIGKYDGVEKVDAILNNHKVKIWGNFSKTRDELAKDFTKLIEKDGYEVSVQELEKKKVNWGEFKKALPFAGIIIVLFIFLQKIGVLETLNPESISLPSIFMIGIVASLSSCMAVVGGLVLSISANYAKEESKAERAKPMIMFHASRIVSFFILGGVLGILGTAFSIVNVVSVILGVIALAIGLSFIRSENATVKLGSGVVIGVLAYILFSSILNEQWARFTLSFITGLVMVILALNLLEIFDFTKKLQFRMPKSLSKTALNTENVESRFAPLMLGLATFFLPCGFTQSMQFQALGSGSFVNGAMTMFVYSLGTLPVLAAISFASNNLVDSKKTSGVFFKTAGLIVLFFALINLIGALVVAGLMSPIFSF